MVDLIIFNSSKVKHYFLISFFLISFVFLLVKFSFSKEMERRHGRSGISTEKYDKDCLSLFESGDRTSNSKYWLLMKLVIYITDIFDSRQDPDKMKG